MGVFITLYQKSYAAIFSFQPLATGAGVLTATIIVALCFRVRRRAFVEAGGQTLRQLPVPGLTVLFIVGLAYLYNYSGVAYTLGGLRGARRRVFPLVSSYLGWVACFLSGSDTAGKFAVRKPAGSRGPPVAPAPAAAEATNSSGAVAGKRVSPQNIAVGVKTVGPNRAGAAQYVLA